MTLGRVPVAAHLRGGPEADRRRPVVRAQRTVRQQSANEAPLPLRTTAGSAKSRIETRRGFRIRGKRPCSARSDVAARTSVVSENDR